MNNIYPDLSNDVYDIPYSRRKILASDLLIRGFSGVNGRLTEGGEDLDGENSTDDGGSDGEVVCCGLLPPDDLELDVEEGLVDELGVNVDHVIATLNEAFITRFKNYGVKLFRNYVEQQFGVDYVWHYSDALIQFTITPELSERFTFQGIMNPLDMYAETTYVVEVAGDNINRFLKENSTIILTTFIGARIRIFRNEVLQSFVNDFQWNRQTGELVLTIAPQETETFKVIPY